MTYILVIDHYTRSIVDAVKHINAQSSQEPLGTMLITRKPELYSSFDEGEIVSKTYKIDFDDSTQLKAFFDEHGDSIAGVICRGDKQIQYLRKVVPYLHKNVLVASSSSLEAATNKLMMRQLFSEKYPEITPSFKRVYDASADTVDEILKAVPLPVIVKPAGLVSSLLITACRTKEELQSALENTFSNIRQIYEREERQDETQVVVEQFLEGDFYSIDAYAMEAGKVFYCPPVFYLPAQKIGIDDFFLYKRNVPTELTEADIADANQAVKKCLEAIGLTNSSAHVELIKTANGWKIIEVGPRLGRFRNAMYKQAYGIDHSLNDILIHLGQEPTIPTELKKYCTAYSIYPDREGIVREIKGLDALEERSEGIFAYKVFAKPGDTAKFAKNGGKALAEFIIALENRDEFLALTSYIENNVKAVIDIAK